METLAGSGRYARDLGWPPRNPLSQPGTVWATIAPDDIGAAQRILRLRRSDPAGLLELSERRFGQVTAWCVLGDNVIGAANWRGLSFAEQYEAVTQRAGAFVASAMYYLRVSGAQAGQVLDLLSPRTVSDLPVGGARFVLFTTPAGTVDEEAMVLRVAPQVFLLSCGGGKPPGWLASVAACHPELTLEEDTHACFNIKGPSRLEAVLRLVADADTGSVLCLYPFEHVGVLSKDGDAIRVLRTVIGYEVWAPPQTLRRVWQRVLDDYPLTVICGWDLLNTYRMECTDITFALYPLDLHLGITLHEAGYSWMVTADHDYIGRKALTAPSAPQARMTGLEPAGTTLPVPPVGSEIATDRGDTVGYVTSAAHSPLRGRPLAFGHVHPELTAGTAVTVDGHPWYLRGLPMLASPTPDGTGRQERPRTPAERGRPTIDAPAAVV